MKKNVIIFFLISIITITGSLLAVLFINNRQQIGKKAVVSGGTATLSFRPAGGNFNVGSVIPVAIWFNTRGTFISAVSLRANYSYSGTTPELSAANIQINSNLLTTGDWSCPVKTITPVSGTMQIDIACINVSTAGYFSSEETLLGQFSLSIDRNPSVNPVTLRFDPAQSKITRKNDAQDILGTLGAAVFQIGSGPTTTPNPLATSTPTVIPPTPTLTLAATPTSTPRVSATPTPTLPATCQAATTISLKFCYGQCASCENACGAHACIRVFHPAGAPADPDCANYEGTTTEYTAYKCTDTLPKSICSCANLPTGNPTPGGATPTPTLALSPTATVTIPPGACPLKNRGDADCNGDIKLADFFIWRREFLAGTHAQADFNVNGVVDINDFFAWRRGFLAR